MEQRCSGREICDFRERRSSFSLDLRSFRPSVLDEAKRKVILRGEGYAWTPIWLRAMFMVRDILRLDLAVNSISKPLNRVEKIPNLVAVNSANPRVSLFM